MNNSRCFSSTPSILFEKHQEKTRLKEVSKSTQEQLNINSILLAKDFRVESKRDSQENEGKSKVKTDQIRSSKKSYSETESKDEDYTRVHEALGKGVTIQ
ncbi:hypothetical protein BT96DRAFT_985001 [Gymnopus androsaceus JB14]|uniref:Uncharacterized protein n=1 Tax=Gymnopus androsaceus JB14 TaxID=1447944 RepID=A0A6A4IHX0_9AGAR|nr:hypothetical protein BT96DRAFT_985001 [Gymnopus androsaceus JB14]